MQSLSSQPDLTTQARRSGLVIATIGLHLLLCSVATAATAAGDSIDRSARRLPAQVVQAFREMVDRSATVARPQEVEGTPGYRLAECPRMITPAGGQRMAELDERAWARRLLNLPPPIWR